MEIVKRYIVNDGSLFESEKLARHYLDKIYGDKLLPLASKLVNFDKYTEMVSYIDENLDKFIELKRIKDDMNLIALDE